MAKPQRRSFLQTIGGITAATMASPFLTPLFTNKLQAAVADIKHLPDDVVAQDETFWFRVRQAYAPSSNVINLNNGGVSPQPVAVQDSMKEYNDFSNEAPAHYMWHVLGKGREMVRRKLGKLSGCSEEELALCRNATEALNSIIFGLDLKAGDEVLTSHQDYPNMQSALIQRSKRDGVKINRVSLPVPCHDPSEITAIYRKAITPKTKVMLICHMINLTGQILPVRDICDMAHEKGIEVIVDGAHSYAHVDFNIPDLHCDYFGTSLHKWLSAPFGTGMMYVKKDKIEKLWPMFGAPETQDLTNIRKFEHQGTRSFPAELGIGSAIDFHNGVGSKRKEERLRFLKQYWVDKLQSLPGFKLNTSPDHEQSCGIANFSMEGQDHKKLFDYLVKSYIFTTRIKHDEVDGMRISPHIYTLTDDLDYFVAAVKSFVNS